jgi:hypothetical protein
MVHHSRQHAFMQSGNHVCRVENAQKSGFIYRQSIKVGGEFQASKYAQSGPCQQMNCNSTRGGCLFLHEFGQISCTGVHHGSCITRVYFITYDNNMQS